jgi:hypothetical protein
VCVVRCSAVSCHVADGGVVLTVVVSVLQCFAVICSQCRGVEVPCNVGLLSILPVRVLRREPRVCVSCARECVAPPESSQRISSAAAAAFMTNHSIAG